MKLTKRLCVMLFSVCLLFSCVPSVFAKTPDLPFDASYKIAILSADNGQVLTEQSGDVRTQPYELINYAIVLTAYRFIDMNETITVPSNILEQIPSYADVTYLEPGEDLTGRDLIGVLLYANASDAAWVLATQISGSVDAFVDLMNDTVARCGARNTHFSTIYTVEAENHYTTAVDIARIGRAVWQQETLREFLCNDLFTIDVTNKKNEARHYANPLDMRSLGTSRYYEYARGGRATSHIAMSFSESDTMSLICVMLDLDAGTAVYSDLKTLMKYGYEYYQRVSVAFANSPVARIPIYKNDLKIGYADAVIRGTFTYYAELFSRKPTDAEGLAAFFSHTVELPSRLDDSVTTDEAIGEVRYQKLDDADTCITMPIIVSQITVSTGEDVPKQKVKLEELTPIMIGIRLFLAALLVFILWKIFWPKIRAKGRKKNSY